MKFNLLFKSVVICAIIILIASCDRDYNEIGTKIVGNDDHYGLLHTSSDVVAYNQNLGAVQTNNLPINSLGFYHSSVFGNTTASFVTQVQLANPNPTFYGGAYTITKLDSVYIYVPYYSTVLSTDATSGDSTYQLDSILGSNKIKLSIYRSGFDILDNSNNPNFTTPIKYYNDQQPDVDAVKGQMIYSNDNFTFDNSQIKFFKPDATTVDHRLAPGIFINLPANMVQYFWQNIIQTSSSNLFNNIAFKNYFKGLYFKAEASPGQTQGTLARLNFAQGKIMMIYKGFSSDPAANSTIQPTRQEMTLNLTGNTINLINNDFVNPISAPNPVNGDNRLYLKGGDGSMAVMDLFERVDNLKYDGTSLVSGQNGVPDQLDKLRHPSDGKNILINDASLTLYIDKAAMGTEKEPNRVYLYDLTNNRPIIDYYNDVSTSVSSKYAKSVYGGIILDDNNAVVPYATTTARGAKYKVRITNYLKSLVKNGDIKDANGNITHENDSTNVKIGLVVTENIGNTSRSYLKNTFSYPMWDKKGVLKTVASLYVPAMSVVNPLGTVLYGSTPSVPDDKRIKLNIWYTKPD